MALRYFDLQARNYVPVLIPLSSLTPPPPSLPKSNMESFYQASFFFLWRVGVELCSMQDTVPRSRSDFPALCSGSLEDSPPTTSKVPVSVPGIFDLPPLVGSVHSLTLIMMMSWPSKLSLSTTIAYFCLNTFHSENTCSL